MAAAQKPPRRALWIAFGLGLSLYAWLAWRFDFVCDDAYISFRYAKNWVQGEGLVFNLGEKQAVEGYSNFLWVLWCGLFEALGWDVALAVRISSALIGGWLLLRLLQSTQAMLGLGTRELCATALFFACLPPVAMWATSGLETMAAGAALFFAWDALLREPERPRAWAAGTGLALAALLRADGALAASWILAAGGVLWLLEGRPKLLLRALLLATLICACCIALHLLWRHNYYGEWLPNTARVKAGFSLFRLDRGWRYLLSFVVSVPTVLVPLLASVRCLRREQRRIWLSAYVFVLASSVYAVWVGGDFMPFGRFLLAAMPFFGLLFALSISKSQGRTAASPTIVLGLACTLLSLAACFDRVPFPEQWRERLHFRLDRPWMSEVERWRDMDKNVRSWALRGKALAKHTRLGESLILGGIGVIGYSTELFIYDKYGLVTPEVVAHGLVKPGRSPGHDMGVNEDFFFPPPHKGNFRDKPTYLGATLVSTQPADAGREPPYWEERLPSDWAAHPWSKLVNIERYPLEVAEGFPENCELWLLRFLWAPR